MRDLVERGELTEEEAQAMMNGTTLRPPRMKEWMWPTPAAYEDRTSVETIKKLPKDRQKMKMSNLATHVRVTEDQRLWPTPTAGDHSRNTVPPSIGKTRGYDLSMKVVEVEQQMFQTPTAMDHLPPRNEEALKKQYMKNRQGRSEHSTLREQVIYPKPQEMWPTPTTQETEHPSMKLNEKGRRVSPKGKESHSLNLADKVQMWPTPRARDYKDGSSVPPSRVKNPELATLGQKVVMEKQKFWSTPKTSDQHSAHMKNNEKGVPHDIAKGNLRGEVQMWSTPSASLGKHSYNGNNEYYENRIEKGRQKDLAVEMYQKEGLGKLSQNFVEYLMGFPDGLTNPDISNEQLISMNTEQKD
jgi:hypothetical protein